MSRCCKCFGVPSLSNMVYICSTCYHDDQKRLVDNKRSIESLRSNCRSRKAMSDGLADQCAEQAACITELKIKLQEQEMRLSIRDRVIGIDWTKEGN